MIVFLFLCFIFLRKHYKIVDKTRLKMMKKILGFILFGLGVGFLMGIVGGPQVDAKGIPYLEYGLNKIYFVEDCRPKSGSGGDLVSDFNPNDVYNENATKIMTALLQAGYSKVEVAGVMGSLKGESGAFNPGEGENAYMGDATIGDKSFRVTSSPCYNRCGFGIAQWTSGGRQDRLQQYADSKNLSVVSLEAQTGYLIKELGEYGFGPGSFKFGAKADNAESAAKAAVEVCSNYEIPGHTAAEARAKCISRGSETYGRAAYELMQSGGVSGSGSGHASGSISGSTEDGTNVTIIGDSIVEGSKGEILALMPKADIDSKVGRQFDEGLTILEKMSKDSKLRKILVFALGTNGVGTASASNIQKVIDLAGSDTEIVFVTNYTKNNDYSSNNNNFAKAAKDNSNVTVVDWEALVSGAPDTYLSSDGIHPNASGQKQFANLIYDAISGGGSGSEDEDDLGVCEDEDDEVCGGGEAIAKEAVKLAWPDKNHYDQINPEYAKAAGEVGLSQYGVNLSDAQDCGKYVAVVVRKAVDPDFPACCTWTMEEYMANSSNWKEIPNESSESNMKPGDIMVVNEGSRGYGSKQAPSGGQGAAGHVQIYIGEDEKLASASLHSRTGNVGEYFAFSSRGWNYRIFRFVGSVSGGDNCSDGATGNLEGDLKEIEESTGHKVGVAVVAPGSTDVMTAGSWGGGRAWSTINVPLAIAAERLANNNVGSVKDPYGNHCNYDGVSDAVKVAVTKSNNCAAWWLWQSVGGDGGSGANSVNAVLRDGGDKSTGVTVSGDGASLTASKTVWSLKDQAVFAANLSSVSGSGNIMKDMKAQSANDKKAGLNVFDKGISKGGWGSGSGAATRQFGLVKMSNGQCVAVAIGANYYDSSFDVLTKIAQALKDNESELPGGNCPKGL